MRAEARNCLITGTYSRRLLASLRHTGPTPLRGAGLDDPRRAQAGDPLGARLQTFLREQFLAAPRPASDGLDRWAPRWVDQPPVASVRTHSPLPPRTVDLRHPAHETCL
ncbi:hypothetical protein GTR02_10020 [Kineococcus sp. R8]|uniref:hypothetical protein n=1 Tax=Kineococcus siccus TaxID=2696567 RepID=UPI00141332C0|nr:hypothetical protein [Kineococcus siccus]NAZ82153.1 hypothetical protein [Kineococcus siccus]